MCRLFKLMLTSHVVTARAVTTGGPPGPPPNWGRHETYGNEKLIQ